MPLVQPKPRTIRREANISGRPSATWGTVLTSDAAAHTEPASKTQLIASTSFDTTWVNIGFHTNGASATITDSLVRIYVGAASSEQLIIDNLLAGWLGGNLGAGFPSRWYGFPLRIPAGSRISATHRSVRTSTGVTCIIELLDEQEAGYWTGQEVECVGAVTGSSKGTNVTPGTTSEGTLTSIGTNTYDWGYVFPIRVGNTDTTMNTTLSSWDIGSGASTTIPGLDDFLVESSSTEYSWPIGGRMGRFAHVPAGTTLYLRGQTSGTAEAQDCCIYGVF